MPQQKKYKLNRLKFSQTKLFKYFSPKFVVLILMKKKELNAIKIKIINN